MKEFFIRIYAYIKTIIWAYIIRPIKKWYNLCINKCYVPDNERNQQILSYCVKIINDETYQPSNPVEHWIEQNWKESYDKFINTVTEEQNIPKEELPPYEECRKTVAAKTLVRLNEFAIIKER